MNNRIYLSISALLISLPLISTSAQAELSSQTMIGSALGGVVGTSIGHEMGGRDGAILGAAVGAAAGAGIGHNMSQRRYYANYDRPHDYGYRAGRDYRYRNTYYRGDRGYHGERHRHYRNHGNGYGYGYGNPHNRYRRD